MDCRAWAASGRGVADYSSRFRLVVQLVVPRIGTD